MAVHDREDLTDAQLLAATRSDPEAFARFYERYERSIVGYFMRRTADPELTADLTAETFAAALEVSRPLSATTPDGGRLAVHDRRQHPRKERPARAR